MTLDKPFVSWYYDITNGNPPKTKGVNMNYYYCPESEDIITSDLLKRLYANGETEFYETFDRYLEACLDPHTGGLYELTKERLENMYFVYVEDVACILGFPENDIDSVPFSELIEYITNTLETKGV